MGVMIERRDSTPPGGGPQPFRGLLRAQHERLFKALFLLTGDLHEADDIAQEALVGT